MTRRFLLRLIPAGLAARFLALPGVPAMLGVGAGVASVAVKQARVIPRFPKLWTPVTEPGRWWDAVRAQRLGVPVLFDRGLAPYAGAYTRFHGYVEDRSGRVVAWIASRSPNHYYLARSTVIEE